MKKLIFYLLVLFLIFSGSLAWPDSETYFINLFGKDVFTELKTKGEIFRRFSGNTLPSLLPDVESKHEMLKKIGEVKPTVGVEVLIYFDPLKYNLRSVDLYMNNIYNQMRSISTLKGLRFFSDSNRKIYTLFKEAYTIDDYNKRIEDQLVTDIPGYSEIKVFFTDPFLGSYHGIIEYRMVNNYLLMYMKNNTYIWWLFLPVVKPEHSVLLYAFFPCEDKLIFYGFHWAKAFNLFGIVSGRGDDLHERLVTVYNWFLRGINRK